MTDVEKVIKALDCKLNKGCNECPYDEDFNCIGCEAMLQDAKELLKSQQAEIERLKEQEAVEPIPYHRSDGTIFKYECRQCRTKIFKMDLFCRHCGRLVKWE